jgi:hypothetical protein
VGVADDRAPEQPDDELDVSMEALDQDLGDELDQELHEQLDPELDQELDQELRDALMIANARRRHGALGGVLAAGMLGLDQALGRKVKEEIPVVVASNSDPLDIDREGIVIDVDDERSVVAPPMPRNGQPPPRKRAKRRREP